jgi:hypothetical protein
MEEISKLPLARDRHRHMTNHWGDLFKDAIARDQRDVQARPDWARHMPVGANTYSSSLVTNYLADGAITNLQNRWAPLMVASRYFSTDSYKPRSTAQIKQVTAGPTVQTNATNFESGDSTVTNIAVTVSQYSSAAHVSNDELNSGLRLNNLVEITTAKLANQIIEVLTTPVTTGNFTATPLVSAPAAFGFSDMATLWAQLKKSAIKNLLLDGEYLARVINQPTFYQVVGDGPAGYRAFGWDYIALNTDWTGAGANVRGFALNPQAIAAVAGLPLTPPEGIPGNNLSVRTFTIDGLDISIAMYTWFQLSARTAWVSYDMMFGASLGDASAGICITSQ